jgi:hypothetical protein
LLRLQALHPPAQRFVLGAKGGLGKLDQRRAGLDKLPVARKPPAQTLRFPPSPAPARAATPRPGRPACSEAEPRGAAQPRRHPRPKTQARRAVAGVPAAAPRAGSEGRSRPGARP